MTPPWPARLTMPRAIRLGQWLYANNPALRLLIYLILGIAGGAWLGSSALRLGVGLSLLGLSLLIYKLVVDRRLSGAIADYLHSPSPQPGLALPPSWFIRLLDLSLPMVGIGLSLLFYYGQVIRPIEGHTPPSPQTRWVVDEPPRLSAYGSYLIARPLEGDRPKAMLFLPTEQSPQLGDTIQPLKARIRSLEEMKRGMRRWLLSLDIYEAVMIDSFALRPRLEPLSPQEGMPYLYALQEQYAEGLGRWLSPESQYLLSALTLGRQPKERTSWQLREQFRQHGLAHLLVVSGFHLGIVYLLLEGLAYLIPYLARQRYLRLLLILSGLWGFALLSGLGVATLRACLMLSLVAVAHSLILRPPWVNLLAVTALVQLLYRPMLLFSPSFLLSYGAVVSLLLYYPSLVYLLPDIRRRSLRYLWRSMVVTLAVQPIILPLVCHFFGEASLLFIWLALPMALTASLLIPLGLLMLFLPSLPPIQSLLALVVEPLSQLMIRLVTLGRWGESMRLHLPLGDGALLLILSIVLLLGLQLRYGKLPEAIRSRIELR